MSQIEKYKLKKPQEFTRLVGVSYGTFSIILSKLKAEIVLYHKEKLTRQRGRKCSLSLEDQLLLCLLYLRNYDTLLNLGFQFSISESYAQKRNNFTKILLLRSLDLPDEASLKDAIANEKIAIDVAGQAIECPLVNQQSYYSGKKTTYYKNTTNCMPFDGLNSCNSL